MLLTGGANKRQGGIGAVGLGLVDGVAGGHIAISPAFTVTTEQVDEKVRVVTEAVRGALPM
jgi:hypothetical protein